MDVHFVINHWAVYFCYVYFLYVIFHKTFKGQMYCRHLSMPVNIEKSFTKKKKISNQSRDL